MAYQREVSTPSKNWKWRMENTAYEKITHIRKKSEQTSGSRRHDPRPSRRSRRTWGERRSNTDKNVNPKKGEPIYRDKSFKKNWIESIGNDERGGASKAAPGSIGKELFVRKALGESYNRQENKTVWFE